ncbi:MAG: ethylbenzene dehydrogenase-related protein [Desulfuromusa sp.]
MVRNQRNVRGSLPFFLCLFLLALFGSASWVNAASDNMSVPDNVKGIIMQQCVQCHSGVSPDHLAANEIAAFQCGACHVPFKAGHDVAGCVECHDSPAATHFYLRDEEAQTELAGNAADKCIACHTKGKSHIGKGSPALNTDARIIAAVRQGTLRSWIQPGGFMAKYLSPGQTKTVTEWIDSISKNRELGYDPLLKAVKVSEPPVIDGNTTDKAWALAPSHMVNLTPRPPYTATDKVELKAVYDDSYVYIQATYPDATLSMTRAGSWKWIKSGWAHPTAASDNDKQSEDRISLIWNMTIQNYRDRYGCAIKCHGNVPGSSEFTDQAGAMADIWHTKAARSLGALKNSQEGKLTVLTKGDAFEVTKGQVSMNGWLDDKRLVSYMNLKDGYDLEDSGRRGDSGKSAYSHNRNKAKKAPKFMETKPADYIDAMVLTQREIDAGEVVVADPASPDYAGDKVIAKAWKKYRSVKAVVPERILRDSTGSRGDVLHSATWKNGVWTNEFKRALNTGHPNEDVQFTNLNKDYEFSIAVFDNCGRGEIPPGHNTYGDGQYQVLRFIK